MFVQRTGFERDEATKIRVLLHNESLQPTGPLIL